MSSSSDRRETVYLPSATARGFSLAGMVMVILFLTVVAGSLFPIQLLNPAWQLRVGSALINSSPMPLTGLALLHLASSLDLRDPQLSARRQLAARLAIPVALGFLLLFPLLTTAALQQQGGQSRERNTQVRRATTQVEALRQAAANATSVDDLRQRFRSLQGPQLNETELTLPLPVLRTRINAALDRVVAQIERQKPAAAASNPWALLPEVLRSGVACIALFVGFAGLARRPQAEMSFLGELQAGLQRSFGRPSGPRTSNKRGVALPGDVFARLAKDEEDEAAAGGAPAPEEKEP
jgi:hypothetical protein